MTKVFRDVVKGTSPYDLYYVWSAAANWVGGVAPIDGDAVAYTAATPGSDAQADDIASLTLNSLSLAATAASYETLYVGGNLTVGTLTLTSVGAKAAMLEATDTFGSSPIVAINGLAGSRGTLFAYGAGATIRDNAAADPGGFTYESGNGGVVFVKNTPAATSTLAFYDAQGVIELANPGATISAALVGVRTGDALELPGAGVANVLYGANTITVVTNVASYTFSNVAYSGTALGLATGFYGGLELSTGLERIVFATPVFSSTHAAASGPFAGEFLWSDAANWSGGLVPNGGTIALSNPAAVIIDEPKLALTELKLDPASSSFPDQITILVNGSVTVGSLAFASGLHWLQVDTTIAGGAATASFTVTGSIVAPTDGLYANGAGATLDIACADDGSHYDSFLGGTIVFGSSISAASYLGVSAQCRIEFRNPGASIAAYLAIHAAGAAIELPGASFVSAALTATTLTVTTNVGTYAFTNLFNTSGNPLLGLIASHDAATGLETFVFATNADAMSLAVSGPGIVSGSATLGVGAHVTFTIRMSSAVVVDTTFGAPRLALSDGGFATYTSGSGTNALIFTYVVSAGQNATDLSVIGYVANGGTILDAANDAVVMTGAIFNPAGALRVYTNPDHFRADFNDDKTSDLLWYNKTTGGYYDSLIAGGVAGAKIGVGALAPAAGWKLAGIGDFNGDGSSDLLFRNAATGGVVEWDVKAGKRVASNAIGAPGPATGWTIAAVGDFNNDGTSDILFRNASTGALTDWMMLNDKHVATGTVATSLASGLIVAGTGDFNGDGTADLLIYNPATRGMQDWLMGKGVRTAAIAIGFAPAGTTFCGAGDFNKDGTDDLVFAAAGGALTLVTLTAGARGATSSLGKAMPGGFTYAAVGDFNGDGRADLLAYDATTGALDVGLTGANGQIAAWTALGPAQAPSAWRFAA